MNRETHSSTGKSDQGVFDLAFLAYDDTKAAARSMPKLFVVSIAFLAIAFFLSEFPAPEFIQLDAPMPPAVGKILIDVLAFFLITPMQIAIYRKSLRNERTDEYEFPGTDGISAKFLVLGALIAIPGEFFQLAFRLPAVTTILTITGFYISIKAIMRFPAIAIDESTPSIAATWAQTKGRFWRIFWTSSLATIPWGIMYCVIAGPAEIFLQNSDLKAIAIAATAIPIAMMMATNSAAVARIYQEVQGNKA